MRGAGSSFILLVVACSGDPGLETDAASGSTSSSMSPTESRPHEDSTSGSERPDESSSGAEPANQSPIAVISVTPPAGEAPVDAVFDGSGSRDPDGTIVEYAWAFSDGSSGDGVELSRRLDAAGCYEATLTVTDDAGATGTATATVVVTSGPPAIPVQAEVDVAPRVSAVLPRDLETQRGTALFSGQILSDGFHAVVAEVIHEGEVVERVEVPLCGPAPASFELDVPIPAELRAFDVELSARAADVIEPIAEVTDLVAGDIYVVTGQSNAVSGQYSGDANVNRTPFIRSFGVNTESGPDTAANTSWHRAQGNGAGGPGGIGQWPIRMARLLSETHQIPIAIVNGARGGRAIDYFQRDDGDPENLSTNYGRLLTRMRAAGIEDRVRAILWYQGESDDDDFEGHRAGFLELRDDWAEDYPGPERLYVTQLRAGCGGDLIRTQEVQRLLADQFEQIAVMSTTALDGHDGCHYEYAEGYEELGERYAALVGRDLYGEIPATDVEPPNPASARFEAGGTEVVITLRNQDSVVTFEPGAELDFRLEGSGADFVGGSARGHELRLTLDGDGRGASGVTYLGREGAGDWVINENGIGLLEFWNLSISR